MDQHQPPSRRSPGRPRRLDHDEILARWTAAMSANNGVSPSKSDFAKAVGVSSALHPTGEVPLHSASAGFALSPLQPGHANVKSARQTADSRMSHRSKAAACKVESNSLLVDFKNGDKIVFDLNEVTPGTEALLAKPLSPKRAFRAAQKAMGKVEGCSLHFLKPLEAKADPDGGTIRIYWCKENSALSVTTDSTGKATRFRTWLIH